MKRLVLAAALLLLCSVVPATAANPDIRQMLELNDLSGVALSPNGAWVAFRQDRASIESNGYVLDWYVMPADGSAAPRRVAGGGEALINSAGILDHQTAVWSADSRSFWFRALIDGEVQVWQADRGGAAARRVTSDAGNVLDFRVDPATGRLQYKAGASRQDIVRAELAEFDNGVRIDGSRDVFIGLFRQAWIDGRWASRRWKFWFDSAGLLSDQAPSQKVQEPGGEAWTAQPEDLAAFERFAWMDPVYGMPGPVPAADGRMAKVVIGENGENGNVQVADDGSFTNPQICTEAACWRAAGIAWRSGRAEVVFTALDHAQVHTMYRWDLAQNKVSRIVTGDGLLSGSRNRRSSCAIGTAEAVCVTAAASRPPRLERIDLETGARTVLFDPNPEQPIVQAERLDWEVKGNKFSGQLFLPPGTGPGTGAGAPVPLFINYYICEGFVRGGMGEEWPLVALARNGIAALCINSARLPGQYSAPKAYRAAEEGIEQVVRMLARRGVIDPKRVGQGGLSFGSEVTMRMLTNSKLLKAASISSAQIEPVYYWANGHAGRHVPEELQKTWGLGDPARTAARWKEMVPALNTDRIKAPLLMQLPEHEARYIPELFARLTRSTTPVDLYAFPQEAHNKFLPRHRLAVFERNLDWFRFWLQGYEDPDPAKAAQYVHWRAMRVHAPAPTGRGLG